MFMLLCEYSTQDLFVVYCVFSKLCGLRSGKATKTCLRLNLDRIKKKCSAVSERKALKFCNLLKFRK